MRPSTLLWIPISLLGAAVLLVLGARFTTLVAELAYTLTFAAVLLSLAAAILRRGPAGALWRGCAVFAAGYFLLAVLAPDRSGLAAEIVGLPTEPARGEFIPSFWLAWMYDRLGGPEIWTGGGTRVPALHLLRVSPRAIPKDLDLSDLDHFLLTGHCICTWFAGIAGGVVGRWFCTLDRAAGD